jgi:signal transduction histidine kinase
VTSSWGENVPGTAILCDTGGLLTQVLHDGLGIASGAQPGRPFTQLIDPACLGKALSFLSDLRAQGAAFDWELTVSAAGAVRVLHFTGVVAHDKLLIVAARSESELHRCCEELVRLGGQQATALRHALSNSAAMERRLTGQAIGLYDELSRLNNELVTLQRELAKTNAELAALIEQKNQFLGMAAHDLRNPLFVVQSCADHLLAEASPWLHDEQIEFLSVIESYSGFMLHMVEDLLDVSAIESGKLALSPKPTDLVALVERNLSFNSILAETKGIRLTFWHSRDLPLLNLDPVRIEQVLNNLVSNAIKYSHPGSSVELRLEQQADQIVISVEDHGQGIPPEELDRLFKWFGTTSVRGTEGERSTGLGLAITRRIVAGHQGEIWVESEVGRGSTFSFSLPSSLALTETTGNDHARD